MEKPTAKKNQDEKMESEGSPQGTVVLSPEEHRKLLEQAKELEALRDKFLRSAADYENARKRLAKEREEFVRFSQEKLIRDLLPALDNFERALTHSQTSNQESSSVVTGIHLIWKQLLNVLSAHGLKRFSSEGQPFNPELHEVVDQVDEEGPEGVVVKEIVPGYSLHERILRPAKVRIRIRSQEKVKPVEEKEEEIT